MSNRQKVRHQTHENDSSEIKSGAGTTGRKNKRGRKKKTNQCNAGDSDLIPQTSSELQDTRDLPDETSNKCQQGSQEINEELNGKDSLIQDEIKENSSSLSLLRINTIQETPHEQQQDNSKYEDLQFNDEFQKATKQLQATLSQEELPCLLNLISRLRRDGGVESWLDRLQLLLTSVQKDNREDDVSQTSLYQSVGSDEFASATQSRHHSVSDHLTDHDDLEAPTPVVQLRDPDSPTSCIMSRVRLLESEVRRLASTIDVVAATGGDLELAELEVHEGSGVVGRWRGELERKRLALQSTLLDFQNLVDQSDLNANDSNWLNSAIDRYAHQNVEKKTFGTTPPAEYEKRISVLEHNLEEVTDASSLQIIDLRSRLAKNEEEISHNVNLVDSLNNWLERKGFHAPSQSTSSRPNCVPSSQASSNSSMSSPMPPSLLMEDGEIGTSWEQLRLLAGKVGRAHEELSSTRRELDQLRSKSAEREVVIHDLHDKMEQLQAENAKLLALIEESGDHYSKQQTKVGMSRSDKLLIKSYEEAECTLQLIYEELFASDPDVGRVTSPNFRIRKLGDSLKEARRDCDKHHKVIADREELFKNIVENANAKVAKLTEKMAHKQKLLSDINDTIDQIIGKHTFIIEYGDKDSSGDILVKLQLLDQEIQKAMEVNQGDLLQNLKDTEKLSSQVSEMKSQLHSQNELIASKDQQSLDLMKRNETLKSENERLATLFKSAGVEMTELKYTLDQLVSEKRCYVTSFQSIKNEIHSSFQHLFNDSGSTDFSKEAQVIVSAIQSMTKEINKLKIQLSSVDSSTERENTSTRNNVRIGSVLIKQTDGSNDKSKIEVLQTEVEKSKHQLDEISKFILNLPENEITNDCTASENATLVQRITNVVDRLHKGNESLTYELKEKNSKLFNLKLSLQDAIRHDNAKKEKIKNLQTKIDELQQALDNQLNTSERASGYVVNELELLKKSIHSCLADNLQGKESNGSTESEMDQLNFLGNLINTMKKKTEELEDVNETLVIERDDLNMQWRNMSSELNSVQEVISSINNILFHDNASFPNSKSFSETINRVSQLTENIRISQSKLVDVEMRYEKLVAEMNNKNSEIESKNVEIESRNRELKQYKSQVGELRSQMNALQRDQEESNSSSMNQTKNSVELENNRLKNEMVSLKSGLMTVVGSPSSSESTQELTSLMNHVSTERLKAVAALSKISQAISRWVDLESDQWEVWPDKLVALFRHKFEEDSSIEEAIIAPTQCSTTLAEANSSLEEVVELQLELKSKMELIDTMTSQLQQLNEELDILKLSHLSLKNLLQVEQASSKTAHESDSENKDDKYTDLMSTVQDFENTVKRLNSDLAVSETEVHTATLEINRLTQLVISQSNALNSLNREKISLESTIKELKNNPPSRFNMTKAQIQDEEDMLAKEAIRNLSQMVREKEWEIESLKGKNETLLEVINSTSSVSSPNVSRTDSLSSATDGNCGRADPANISSTTKRILEEKENLRAQLKQLKEDREKFIVLVNQKHKESVSYHEELKRLWAYINETKIRYDSTESERADLLDQCQNLHTSLTNTTQQLSILKSQFNAMTVRCSELSKSQVNSKEKDAELATIRTHLVRLRDAYRTREEELAVVKSRLVQVELIRSGSTSRELDRVRNQLDQAQNHVKQLTEEISSLKQERNNEKSSSSQEHSHENDSKLETLKRDTEELLVVHQKEQSRIVDLERIVDDLEEQIKVVTSERDAGFESLSLCQAEVKKQTDITRNLQGALEAIQNEQLEATSQETERLQREINRISSVNSELEEQITDLETRLKAQSDIIDAAQRLSVQMDFKDTQLKRVNEAMKEKDEMVQKLTSDIKTLKTEVEQKIEKELMKNLMIAYIQSPIHQKGEALRLVGKLLNFTDKDYDKLSEDLNDQSGKSGSWFGWFNQPQNSGAPPTVNSNEPNSFGGLFSQYLTHESQHSSPSIVPSSKKPAPSSSTSHTSMPVSFSSGPTVSSVTPSSINTPLPIPLHTPIAVQTGPGPTKPSPSTSHNDLLKPIMTHSMNPVSTEQGSSVQPLLLSPSSLGTTAGGFSLVATSSASSYQKSRDVEEEPSTVIVPNRRPNHQLKLASPPKSNPLSARQPSYANPLLSIFQNNNNST